MLPDIRQSDYMYAVPKFELKCKLTEDVEFKTKPQLAAEMLRNIAEQKQVPFRYILADSVYGTSPDFFEAAESLVGVTYLVQMPEDTLCWHKHKYPFAVEKTYIYRGQKRTKNVHTFHIERKG